MRSWPLRSNNGRNPAVEVAHTLRNPRGQISATQMTIKQGRLGAAMAGVSRDLMQIQAGPGHVRQPEMPQGMWGELRDARPRGHRGDDLGPHHGRERLGMI